MTRHAKPWWPSITPRPEKVAAYQTPTRGSVCSSHPRREGDEFVCICGSRWGVNEERPCGRSS